MWECLLRQKCFLKSCKIAAKRLPFQCAIAANRFLKIADSSADEPLPAESYAYLLICSHFVTVSSTQHFYSVEHGSFAKGL